MYKDFRNWEEYEGFSPGSGTSSQEWIIDPTTKEIGLFKDRKGPETTDNFSEKIASEVAVKIGIEAARIDLAIWKDERRGMISYLINSGTERLEEGILYISKVYPLYNRDDLIDDATGEVYNIEMILKSIEDEGLKDDVLKILIFDFLIGNTDRHHSNWAVLRDGENIRICPVYDNTSSLCGYLPIEKIRKCIGNPKWINAQVESKAKTVVKIDGKIKKKYEKQKDLLLYIKEKYYKETIEFVRNIKKQFTYTDIETLLGSYTDVLEPERIKLITEFLKGKLNMLLSIYDIK